MTIPLSGWADRELAGIAAAGGCVDGLSGAMLLGERAALAGFVVPGRVSAGGGCRLYDTTTAPVALNLARADDRALLPALFGDGGVSDDTAIAAAFARSDAAALVARGRELGLAIAGLDEASPALAGAVAGAAVATQRRPVTCPSPTPAANGRGAADPPLVIDLSALWAGPLATNLLHLAGATVVKVESRRRPDAMRDGDPALFARLNSGKASVALDLHDDGDRAALLRLVARAQLVIEAARPRALLQLGIDADALVRAVPGLGWITITGHGFAGEAANWVGFGDDVGVAAGLSAALLDAAGAVGFVGDAIADPLTGLHAARLALEQQRSGSAARIVVSMRGVAAAALAAERRRNSAGLAASLRTWAAGRGQPFPGVASRPGESVAAFGADSAQWLGQATC